MQKAAFQRSRHLTPGDKLGKYEVIRQIAVGGMAEIYLARTTGIEGFEKLVVLKRILPQYVANASFVNMFLNEARLAAMLHHPNVAQVYDIGVEDGDYFFAMEYVHGEDLDHMHIAADEQGVPISMDAALTLVAGLCAGLHYAHDKASPEGKPLGIVHRDVSPSNVLVSYDGAVKLVDFGIARAASRPGTTQGGLKGKIAYMSPEQCRSNKSLDRRSDIYSVGTLLYQLTTGRMPFKGETEYQILNQIVNDDVPPPSTVVPSYPPALAAVVMKALQRDPDKRYVNALELQSAVEDFAHESRLRVSPLVLARLMGTLFPARLEEWDHAKAQGAFFVEQHVVRTLIESGRTPDRSDPVVQAQVAAAAVSDDDPTQINTTFNKQHLAGDGSDSVSAATTPSIPSFANQRPSSQPQAYPVMGAPGVLVSSTAPSTIAVTPGPTPFTPHGAVQVTPPSIDVTERVRAPVAARQTSPTKFVRTGPSRKGVFILASLFAIAGGIAVFIVTRGSDAPVSSPSQEPTSLEAKPEAKPPETPEAKPAAEIKPEATAAGAEPSNAAGSSAAANDEIEIDEPAKAEPVAEKGEPAKAEPVTEKVEPAKTEPVAEKVEPTKAEPVATKTEPKKTIVAKRPKAKTEPKKTPPKEKTWNSDSPFMPVRTGK